jgi:ubiquinone/menaquinone biosynthesis C-methylase UbiE
MKGFVSMVVSLTRRIKGKLRRFVQSAVVQGRPGDQHSLGILVANQNRLFTEIAELRGILGRVKYQTTVAPDGFPIPPPEFHAIVSGTDGLDADEFLRVGKSCSDGIRAVLANQNVDLKELHSILDFGCGCGRVIRNFHDLSGPQLFGTDYDSKLVNWCRRNLPFASFELNGLAPPLVFPDSSFDLIYAYSVFTHLSETLQSRWLTEFHRVLRPGGYLIITTLGQACAEYFLSDQDRDAFRLGHMITQGDAKPGEGWYNVFQPSAHVQELFARHFEMVDFIPGEVLDSARRHISQDCHLLRKAGPRISAV